MTKDELIKIYNNAINTLESEDGYYWTIEEQRKYAQGYIEALVNNEFITHKEALSLCFEIDQAIDNINENRYDE